MYLRDSIKTAFRGLTHAKTRSLLTILGIVIGISSVILLMSIGQSAKDLILNQVEGTGSNLIFVIPGGTNKSSRFASPASVQGIIIKTLVQQDADALRREPSIAYVAPQVSGQAKVIYENNDLTASYQGITSDFFPVRNFNVTEGYTFTNTDVLSANHVAVIGSKIAETLFGNVTPLGKTIRLKNSNFNVIGVLEKKGLGPFGVDQDSIVLIPISVAQKQLLGTDYYNAMTIQARSDYTIDFVKSRITSVLRETHRITDPDKDDFTIQTQEDALALLGNITTILTLFLTSIAAISLVVGGIGIMNIMLVSVIERTKEIGLRKALGATNRDILSQFLWESIMLTAIGGVIGITIGASFVVLLWFALSHFSTIGWTFALPPSAIVIALGVSAFTGIVFGIYPAREASKRSPMEALRYE